MSTTKAAKIGLFGFLVLAWAVSATINAVYNYQAYQESPLLGVAGSLCIDAFKVGVLFALDAAVRRRAVFSAIGSALLWGVVSAYCAALCFAWVVTNLNDSASARRAPAASDQSLLQQLQQQTDLIPWLQRQKIEGDARNWARFDEQIRTAEAKLEDLRAKAMARTNSKSADPLGDAYHKLTGRPADDIRTGLALLFALIIEFGAAFSPYLAKPIFEELNSVYLPAPMPMPANDVAATLPPPEYSSKSDEAARENERQAQVLLQTLLQEGVEGTVPFAWIRERYERLAVEKGWPRMRAWILGQQLSAMGCVRVQNGKNRRSYTLPVVKAA